MADIDKWRAAFEKLHIDRSSGIAPHKPVLLLAVLELIERGIITDGKVYFNNDLLFTCRAWWDSLVEGRTFNMAMPFFHMQSERFWTLVPKKGHENVVANVKQLRSIGEIREHIDHAKLDPALFTLLTNSRKNVLVVRTIQKAYFETQGPTINERQVRIRNERDLEIEILKNNADTFQLDWKGREGSAKRNAMFRQFVLHAYDYTCAVCRLSIGGRSDGQLLDAAHIVPYAIMNNDDVRNGLCLCKNHHWAFDRGLIAVDEEYHVKVSPLLDERQPTEWRLTELEGKRIRLPVFSEQAYPAQEVLAWHREKVFQD